jgi:tetratricopeptide (TPR) repeat protein
MRELTKRLAGLLAAALVAVLVLSTPTIAPRADEASDRAVLDNLFAELKSAPDAATAHAIDQRIWLMWLVPSDPELAGRMSAVLAAQHEGNYQVELTLLNKLVIDYPNYAEGWNQLATLEYLLDNFDASLADIDRVLSIEPRHFGALSGRVLIYLAQGNRPMALRAMMAALAVHPFLAEKAMFPELNRPTTQI